MARKEARYRRPFGWGAALAFNLFLLFGLKLGTDALTQAYGNGRSEYVASSEALAATRNAMGNVFEDFVPRGANRREFWAQKIDAELIDGDITAAHGFMLAATHMLSDTDSKSILAASKTAEGNNADERLIEAAQLFLPDDVRANYERTVKELEPDQVIVDPTEIETETELADLPDAENAAGGPVSTASTDGTDTEAAAVTTPLDDGSLEEENRQSFFVLGSLRDLTFQSANWLRGDRIDPLELVLSGVGIAINEGAIEIDNPDIYIQGASIVKTADRARRLHPRYRSRIEQRLFAAVPPDELKANLDAAFASSANILMQGDAILEAFRQTVDTTKLARLEEDFEALTTIQSQMSMTSTIELLEHIQVRQDLARAELVAFAGGARVVALSKYRGETVLKTARTIIDWDRNLVLRIMGLVGVAFGLIWAALGTLGRSFFETRPVTYAPDV